MFAAEAKKRYGETVGRPSKESKVNLPEIKKEPQARDQAAAVVGVSGKMVSDAKAIKKNNPEAFERIKSGAVTVHEQQFKLP